MMPCADSEENDRKTPPEDVGPRDETSAAGGDIAPLSPALHDLLASGEVESALSPRASSPPDGEGSPSKSGERDDGLGARLPLLLRWLSVAQPLAMISPSSDRIGGDSPRCEASSSAAPNLDAIVPLLEDVAAAHPDAEHVEVMVSALAPSICRDAIGRQRREVAPLSRNKKERSFLQRHVTGTTGHCGDPTAWDTKRLDRVLQRLENPAPPPNPSRKRQKEQRQTSVAEKRQRPNSADPLLEKMRMVIDILEEDDDDHHGKSDRDLRDANRVEDALNEEVSPSSFLACATSTVAGDPHGEAVRRALQELVALVNASLPTSDGVCGDGVGEGEAAAERGPPSGALWPSRPGVALRSDSLFAEADEAASSIGGGWSRLSVMVPVLMQHAPILRHEHVANALCRAAAPQAPALIAQMGANCPCATQNLLCGCISAFHVAEKFESLNSHNVASAEEDASNLSHVRDIGRVAVESVRRLASLSRREALAIVCTLKEQHVMEGLALDLLMEHDPVCAAAFIVEELSSPPPKNDAMSSATNQTSDGKRLRQKVPLRQRMLNSRSFGVVSASAENATSNAEAVRPRLREELKKDKALAGTARSFVSRRMIASLNTGEGGKVMSLGEAALFVQAHALLVHCTGIGARSSAGPRLKFVEETMTAVRWLLEGEGSREDLPAESRKDGVYKMVVAAAVVTCCECPPIGDSDSSIRDGPAGEACLDCFRSLLLRPASVESIIFSSRLAGLIIGDDTTNLSRACLKIIFSNIRCEEKDVLQMADSCLWLSKLSETGKLKSLLDMGLAVTSVVHDPIVAVEAIQRSCSQTANALDDLMKRIFVDPDICMKILKHSRVSALIQESVNMLVKRPAPHIPLVLPLSLQRLAQSLPWREIGADAYSTRKLLSQFALQLAYALEFLDRQPLSPFVIDPRSFPLRELLTFLDLCHKKGALQSMLKELISKLCPDILYTMVSDSYNIGHDEFLIGRRCNVKPMMVCEAICDCLKGGHSLDPSGMRAERMFMICRSMHSSSEVDVAAVGALLTAGHSQPPKFYSYAALCKDPLVLLKSSAVVWKYRGMRCIILRILRSLMDANECISIQSSGIQLASDYLVARDVIIFRSIVFACASGFVFGGSKRDDAPHRHCMMCVNMLRSITSKRQGIIAALIKQAPPDFCIDWIVEFIPESLSDAPIITSLLSDIGSLTATERLTAASAGLRIAVAHNAKGETIAKMLFLSSTTVLLDSFSLVIGPIGVPVSILREENGEDLTNVCRETYSKMIRTLATTNLKNTDLHNEASITLSKIATLCKSENAVGGVAGVAAAKRKALLKEIWDACVQANTALGGAMQL